MVKSGLVNDITVSHYRLSIHLSIAILIISIIFWLIKNIKYQKNKKFFKISSNNFPFQFLILIIFLQIIMGAFVSGLDAGKYIKLGLKWVIVIFLMIYLLKVLKIF